MEVEKLINGDDPLASLDPLSLAPGIDFIHDAYGLTPQLGDLGATRKCSDIEKQSSSSNSFHLLEAKIEIDNYSSGSFSEDESFEKQHKLYDPICETLVKKITNKKKKPYECPLCHKWFKTSSAMNGHVAKSHKTTLGEKFSCHVCGAPGSSRASLKRHLIRTHKILEIDHPELMTKKCYHCDNGFPTHKMKYEHIRSLHREQLKLYNQCLWCPALMKAKASLVRHVRRAHPGKEHFYSTAVSCYVCNSELENIPMLQRHMKKEHPYEILHKCDLCTASFKYPYMLAKHKVRHKDPAKYLELRKLRKYGVKCDICSRIFDSKSRLSKHIKNLHSNSLISEVKLYTCKQCDSSFPTANQKLDHYHTIICGNRHYRRVHRPQRQKIYCGKCKMTFKTPQECNEHKATHPNTCEICQKQFLKRDTLREHLLIHSAPRHQCPHCDKKFTQSSNLKRHIRVHTGEKPFKCLYCSRSFSDKSACNSHARVHTGYERSVCNICGASFSKKQRLNYHMRIHSGQGLLHCPLCPKSCTTSYAFRKHVESHLVPLTKACKSLGFGPLFQSDCFLQNALQAIIQATLKGNCDKLAEVGDKKELDARELTIVGSVPLNGHYYRSENYNKNLSQNDVVIKREVNYNLLERCEDSEFNNAEELNIQNTDITATNSNLTKFLQCVLKKESLKVYKKRKLRIRKHLLDYNEGVFLPFNEEECGQSVKEDELPESAGDELVSQCLEIVLKDENNWEENKSYHTEHNNSEKDAGSEQNYTSDKNTSIGSIKMLNSLEIGSSELICPPSNEENERGCEQHTDVPTSQRIPKLKISRISCKEDDDLSEGIFVAEVIEKDLYKV